MGGTATIPYNPLFHPAGSAGALIIFDSIDDRHFRAHREFSVPGDPNAIAPVLEQVMAFIHSMDCVSGKEMEVELALQECLANAVVHGAQSDPGKTVHCYVGCEPSGAVTIAVLDPGPGFNSSTVADPLSPEGLTSGHGRGIQMVRGLMDEVRFERNGAQIIMRKL